MFFSGSLFGPISCVLLGIVIEAFQLFSGFFRLVQASAGRVCSILFDRGRAWAEFVGAWSGQVEQGLVLDGDRTGHDRNLLTY